jgi:uncharacterized membrane protein YkvA (DUF1232 family)
MARKEQEGADYFGEFKDSHWAARGSDPKAEEKVRQDFEDKFKKAEKASTKPGFLENLRLLYEYLMSGEDLAPKALIVGALLYVISPIDIIPDFIPVAGYVDDAAVIAGVVALLADRLRRFREKREAARQESREGRPRKLLPPPPAR